ncbi:uncharacterized protein UTRI_01819_B [Ustilago trichophora]|uniref:Uncharacterized protein n=1 Tax=Ustilago trichophora TaxID=86804 RepID=A0A5C3E5J6_9BASI|nr:uncharacterized protein UTRI_01819_B [Ustilago trichophora]
MTSPLRRSARGARNTDATATTPEPSAMPPSASPTKVDRKRKRGDEPLEGSNEVNGADQHMADAADAAAKDASADGSKPNGVDARAQSADPTSKKTQLSKKMQSLLGIPSSSASAISSPTAEVSSAAQKVEELVLSSDDAKKLSTILSALDAADLISDSTQADTKGKLRKTNGSSTNALEDLLRPGASLRDLRNRLLSMREPLLAKSDIFKHLQVGHAAAVTQHASKDLARLSTLTLVLGLVDQLATHQRQSDASTDALKGQILASVVEERARLLEAKNARKSGAAEALNDDDDNDAVKIWPIRLLTDNQAASRYALHMRLPRGDYFTKAIALDRAQLAKLDPAQADLVQISAQSEAQMRALKRQGLVPTPTLGQRLGRSSQRHRSDSKRAATQPQAKPQPVTFLNYGNYASFAPTYDSSASSISNSTSSTLWYNCVQAQHSVSLAWGDKPFQAYGDEEQEEDGLDADALEEPAPFSATAKGDASADVDGDISMEGPESDETAVVLRSLLSGVDEDDVSASLKRLSQDELVTSHLRFNMMLLHRLQEFQWARLRRSYQPTASDRTSLSAVEDESPSAEEEATAALLLESLSSLVALQPRAADLTSDAVQSVVPDASKLRAFSTSSGAIDPDLLGSVRDGFWGALDANVVKVTKAGSVISETPLVLCDDTTIRLADGSGSKAKKSARRAGPGGSHAEDRGRGALDRFAASRTYDHNSDRHDIDPVRAPSAPGPVSEQRQPSLPQGSSPGTRPGPPLAPSPQQPRQQAMAMSPNARMHPGYPVGPGMTPQAQRLVPGPNASFAFASPAGGLSHGGRLMPPNASTPYPQPSFAHPPAGQANWGQPARQS